MKTCLVSPALFFIAVCLYLFLAFKGLFYGLPDKDHILSYNCDETTWVEGLGRLKLHEEKINPHPEFTHPTGYLFGYGGGLLLANLFDYLPLDQSKEYLREHPEIFSRFYLVGRYLQVACGIIILFLTWLSGRSFFTPFVADFSTIFLAITPSFVATSQFHQANMPVAMLSVFSFSCLLLGAKNKLPHPLWFNASNFFFGLGLGVKFSIASIGLPILFYGFYFYRTTIKIFICGLAAFLLGFFISSPFSLLTPDIFWPTIFTHLIDNQMPIDGLCRGIWFLLTYPYMHALGPVLCFFSFSAIAMMLTKKKNIFEWLLFIWVGSFFLVLLRAGQIANSARIVPIIPFMLILIAIIFEWLKDKFHLPRSIFVFICGILFFTTLVPTLAINRFRKLTPLQKSSSEWITTNIPITSSIGIPRNPFWYSPDIIVKANFHPERLDKSYTISNLNYSIEKTKKLKPDYIVLSNIEKLRCVGWGFPDSCLEFVQWLDQGEWYRIEKMFPRDVSWAGWRWKREETNRYPFYDDHDLWSSSIYIYKKNKSILLSS